METGEGWMDGVEISRSAPGWTPAPGFPAPGFSVDRPAGIGRSTRSSSRTGRCLQMLVGAVALVMALAPAVLPAQVKYTPEHENVEAMCRKAVKYLETAKDLEGGELVLAAITVVEVSKRYDEVVPIDHPLVVKAVEQVLEDVKQMREHLAEDKPGMPEIHAPGIYRLAMSIIFLTDLGADRYRSEVISLVEYFLRQQRPSGAFSYPSSQNDDTSQSQYAGLAFALLKIHEIPLDPEHGVKLLNWFCDVQMPEGKFEDADTRGTWVYHYQNNEPFTPQVTHTMFIAGASSVYLLADYLNLGAAGGSTRGVQKQIEGIKRKLPPSVSLHIALKEGETRRANAPLASFDRGKIARAKSESNDWLKRNFTIQPPGKSWTFYYLYALERYAYFREKTEGGMPEFPTWYDEGVEFLEASQTGNGSWIPDSKGEENENNSTCLATLFLVRSSQILLKDPRQTTLVSNYGVFKGNGPLSDGANGQIKTAQTTQEVTDVLALLKDGGTEEQMEEMLEQLKPALIEFNRKEGKSKAEVIGFLRGLISHPDAYRRLTAVRFLAGIQDLENVPALLKALSDDEVTIALEAHNGLRLISRKLDAYPVSSKPSRAEMAELKQKWTAWYLGIRPGAVLLD